jgi:VanZ family protein
MSHTSSTDSSNQSGFIVNFINNILHLENTELLEMIIRKFAHLFEYTILGVLTINCSNNFKIKNYILLAIIFCLFYAISDEIHQIFIPGRNGNIKDVLIDTAGSFTGIIIYNLYYKSCKKQILMIQ